MSSPPVASDTVPQTCSPAAAAATTARSNYTVGELLGIGGGSRVYNCAENDKLVIKKVEIGPNPSRETKKKVEQICNEIKRLKRLDHPRVVRYIDSYETDTELCMVLEKMPGGSLSHYLGEHGALDEDRCRKYTIQILHGLEYLHNENIIHRDLKGANILLDESSDIKMCDFDIAKLMECTTTSIRRGSQSKVGTPHWMAPEVIKGERYGRKCDIWSLGCTLVEMLTAKPPWSHLESIQAMFKIAQGSQPEYTPPEGLSEAARDFLELCFKIDPEERPTAAALMQHRFVIGDTNWSGRVMNTPDALTSATFRLQSESDMDRTNEELRRLRRELAATYQTRFANLQPVPWLDVKLPISVVYQEQTLAGREDMWRLHDRMSTVKDVFNPPREGGAAPKFLLIEGAPGLGKTTLCQRLMQDWAGLVQPQQSGPGAAFRLPTEHQPGPPDQLEVAYLEHFQLVIFLRVRDLNDSDILANIQYNLLSEAWADTERLASCMRHNIQHVLLIIDGYDEGNERQKGCVDGCLTGGRMRGATIIITSRPGFCHPDPSPDRTYTLQGLDESRQSEYIRVFDTLMGAETDGTCTQYLLTPFQGQEFLQFPLFLTLFCFLARQGQGVLPMTTTALYSHFVNFVCEKALKEPLKFGKNYVAKLKKLMQEMAFKLLKMSQSEITADVLGKYFPGSEVNTTMDDLCKLGLVCQEIKFKCPVTFQSGTFIHQSFLDYFSARYFVSLTKKERSKYLKETEIHQNALVFVAGLCESGGHSDCFSQMLSTWKRQVDERVSPPPFDEEYKLNLDMDKVLDQTRANHALLHAPLLWLNQLTYPTLLSADNVATITQTTTRIIMHHRHCTASCWSGLLSLIKACRDLNPSPPRHASLTRRSPLQTLRQAFSRHRGPLTSQTPLHLTLHFSGQVDVNTPLELLHNILQSRDSVRCVQLILHVYTRDACEHLSDCLPGLTHLTMLMIHLSSWEAVDFVSRGFQSASPLRVLTLFCRPSGSPNPPSSSSLAWSPSSDFLAAISRLDQLQRIQLFDPESSLPSDCRREIRRLLRHRLPHLPMYIYDTDSNNKYKMATADSPD